MDLLGELKTAMKKVDVDVNNIYEEGMLFSDFESSVEDRIREIEVIYYASAMDYLRANDTSLRRSLELAHDMGYTPDNLNSEILATILKQEDEMEEWAEVRDEVESLFHEYEEYLNEKGTDFLTL